MRENKWISTYFINGHVYLLNSCVELLRGCVQNNATVELQPLFFVIYLSSLHLELIEDGELEDFLKEYFSMPSRIAYVANTTV